MSVMLIIIVVVVVVVVVEAVTLDSIYVDIIMIESYKSSGLSGCLNSSQPSNQAS